MSGDQAGGQTWPPAARRPEPPNPKPLILNLNPKP